MGSDYSMCYNLILSAFILIIELPQVSSVSSLQAGSWVFLTGPHHSLNTSLISETTKSSRIITTFAPQVLGSATTPGKLGSVSEELNLKTKYSVLCIPSATL